MYGTLITLAVVAALRLAARYLRDAPRMRVPTRPGAGLGKFIWLAALGLATFTAVEDHPGLPFFVTWAVLLVFMFPWWIARHVLVPLGLVSAAEVLASFSAVRFASDRPGAGLLAAVLAVGRDRSGKRAAWCDEKISGATHLGGSGVLAAGLLADRRGHREEARALLALVPYYDARVCPRTARRFAGEWLAADALARGDLEGLERLAAFDPPLRGSTFSLLAGCGRRLAGRADAPSARDRWWRWLFAPARLSTRRLRRLAASAPSSEVAGPADHRDGPPLARALALHRAVVEASVAEVPSAEALVALAHAWDEALGSLEGNAVAAARERVLESLEALVEEVDLGFTKAAPTGLLGEARLAVRDRRLEDLEIAVEGVRMEQDRMARLPLVGLARRVAYVLDLHAAACRTGPDARYLAYDALRVPMSKHASVLFQKARTRPLATVLIRFLLIEGQAVGDANMVEVQQRNIGLRV